MRQLGLRAASVLILCSLVLADGAAQGQTDRELVPEPSDEIWDELSGEPTQVHWFVDDSIPWKKLLETDLEDQGREQFKPLADRDYPTEGDDSLTFQDDCATRLEVEGSYRVELSLDLEFETPTENGQSTEYRVWLDMDDNTTDSYVWFRQSMQNGEVVSAIFIIDTDGEWNEFENQELIRRDVRPMALPSGRWTLSYRNGLWTVVSPNEEVVYGWILNGAVPVKGFIFDSLKGKSVLNRVAVRSIEERELDVDDLLELGSAERLNQQLIAAFQAANYEEAQRVGELALETRTKILGENHPDTASSINNLAKIHQENGQYEQSIPHYEHAARIYERTIGRDHPLYATAINNIAAVYQLLFEFDLASDAYRESMQIRKDVLGEADGEYGDSVNNYGTMLVDQKNVRLAVVLYERSLEIRRESYGTEHIQYAQSLFNLGTSYTVLNRFEEGMEMLEEAQRIIESQVGRNHPLFGMCIAKKGMIEKEKFNIERGLKLFDQALQVFEDSVGRRHPEFLNTLAAKGVLLLNASRLDEAFECLQECKTAFETTQRTNSTTYVDVVADLARIHRFRADFETAEEVCLEAIRISEDIYGKDHIGVGPALSELALMYRETDRHVEALRLYQRVAEIEENHNGGRGVSYVLVLCNIGMLYESIGNSEEALSWLFRAQDAMEKSVSNYHSAYALILNNIATVHQSLGNKEAAEKMFVQALEMRKGIFGRNHFQYAQSLNNLAVLWRFMGKAEEAESLLRECKEIIDATYDVGHPFHLTVLCSLASINLQLGRVEQAEKDMAEGVRIREQTFEGFNEDHARFLHVLADLHLVQGDLASAVKYQKQALDVMRKRSDYMATIQTERQQQQLLRDVQYDLDHFLIMCSLDPEYAEFGYEQLMRWKGSALERQRRYRQMATDQETAKLFQELQEINSRLTLEIGVIAVDAPVPNDAIDLARRRQELERLLAEKSQNSGDEAQDSSIELLRERMPDGSVLLDFVQIRMRGTIEIDGWEGESIAAFVVPKTGDVRFVKVGDAGEIFSLIESWRNSIDRYGVSGQDQSQEEELLLALAGELRQRLWEPIQTHLDNSHTLLISPDGALGRFPFGALPGKEPDSFLIEDYRIAMVPVPRLMAADEGGQTAREAASMSALLLGGIDYGEPTEEAPAEALAFRGTRGRVFPMLKATSREVSEIQSIFETSTLLTGMDATEQAFRDEMPNHEVIHVATHGFVNAPERERVNRRSRLETSRQIVDSLRTGRYLIENPDMLAGIALSDANRQIEALGKDDGILYAAEIAMQPMSHVQLAVLSACETGIGEDVEIIGEGLIGVQRAFQVAGAESTIASYWKVEDLATQRLMVRFYDNWIRRDMSKLDALHEAQLWMMKSEFATKDVVRGDVVDIGNAPVRDRTQTSEEESRQRNTRAHPRFWAAWVLSGDWN